LQDRVSSDDVTEEFIDLKARIVSQKALEAQFLEILSTHLSAWIKRHDLALDRFERASRIERPLKRCLQRPDFIDIRHDR
jgi:hypothetical protein